MYKSYMYERIQQDARINEPAAHNGVELWMKRRLQYIGCMQALIRSDRPVVRIPLTPR